MEQTGKNSIVSFPIVFFLGVTFEESGEPVLDQKRRESFQVLINVLCTWLCNFVCAYKKNRDLYWPLRRTLFRMYTWESWSVTSIRWVIFRSCDHRLWFLIQFSSLSTVKPVIRVANSVTGATQKWLPSTFVRWHVRYVENVSERSFIIILVVSLYKDYWDCDQI